MADNKNYTKKKIGKHALKPETLMMSYGYSPYFSEGSVKPPVFLTSTFVYQTPEDGEEFFHMMAGRKDVPEGDRSGLIYSRFNHPNAEIIEDRMAILEGSESAAVMSSGMGAVSSVLLGFLKPGDVVLHSAPLYGGTETLIRGAMGKFGVHSISFDDGLDLDSMKAAAKVAMAKGRLSMIFVETPANPTNALVDFKLLSTLADHVKSETGTRPVLVCDNTLLGPIHQRAVPQGIDLAVYSLTKYIGGHSDLIAGAVCGSKDMIKIVKAMRGAIGLNLDPHTSWMISRSLETLTIRMNRAAETALKVAQWIADNPYTKVVLLHPHFEQDQRYKTVFTRQCTGFGSTFSFVLDAPKAKAFKLINALSIFKSAVSLGGTESLVCHPASTTHSGVAKEMRDKVGVTEGLIRLSIGMEHPDDLIYDLDQAFKAVFS